MILLRLLPIALLLASVAGSAAPRTASAQEDARVDPPAAPQAGEGAASEESASEESALEKPALQADGREEATREEKPPEEKAPEEKVREDRVLGQTFRKAMLIDVRGPIFESLKQYLNSRLAAAERGEVDLIILRVTSPGGELEASLELARTLSEIDWATTVAFIPEEAYSGAAILALGCDRIYMRPRALIGDAGPIHFHGGFFEHADEKVVSALAVAIHQLAAAKKRPGALAEAMVDRNLQVYEATRKDTGERAYLTAHEIEEPRNKQNFDIGAPIPEAGQNRFLTVAGSRAVELMLAEGTFDSEQELLDSLHFERMIETRRTWVDQCVYVLNRPLVSGLLLLIGLIGLYVEFAVPGISVAALVSLSCFALFFWSHALGGTSGWLEVMLFALGIGCLGVEIFVLPGFGVFGVTGGLMIILSLVMASQDFVLPQSTVQWTTLRNNLLLVLGAMGSLVAALIIQVMFFDSLPGLGRIRLDAPEPELPAADGAAASLVGAANPYLYLPQLGQHGVADSVLRPAGKVRFDDRLVDVVTEGDFLDPGTAVEVVRLEGHHVIVRRLA
jgi:membrane-bound serine protease (ClpP class)